MHIMILITFGIFFTMGIYFLLAAALRIPTYRTSKSILKMGKAHKKQVKSADAFLLELAAKLSHFVYLSDFRKRKLAATLQSAEIAMTPETYVAQVWIKAGMFLFWIIPCLFCIPILAPAFLIIGLGIYFNEMGSAENKVKKRREEIEFELPRFVATITQELIASRDILSMLETYEKNAGDTWKSELIITTADMRTGNYEAALLRLEARVSSAMLSDIVRGLIGCIRGDDGVAYFRLLSHDMKQIEIQRLKKLAKERPPKIRRYSFLMLACMLLVYLGVMGYQILQSMAELF